jgi:hypothetical protein
MHFLRLLPDHQTQGQTGYAIAAFTLQCPASIASPFAYAVGFSDWRRNLAENLAVVAVGFGLETDRFWIREGR